MPDWLANITIEQIVALCVALTGVFYGGARIWRGLRKIMSFIDDMNGAAARPGVAERPGVMTRLSSIEDGQTALVGDVRLIRHEVLPNEGISLRDEVLSTAAGLKEAVDRLDRHDERFADIERRLPPEV